MSILRPCSTELTAALESGQKLYMADLFDFTLSDGTTEYHWTSFDRDLKVGSTVYSSKSPWLTRTKWNLVNTMQVPGMTVYIRALNTGFDGGANIKLQIHNGLFDGATFLLSRLFMLTPGDASLGTLELLGGVTSSATIIGSRAELNCKGKNNLLAQFAPRNVYQTTCLHAFCDAGCTLSRADFTADFTAGSSGLTSQFIPWSGTAPSDFADYKQGTLTMTSGASSGQSRTIATADATGLVLVFPLYESPAPGDAFTAFQGCDKTKDSGSGQSCTDRSNTQNFRAFPYVPPPNSAY